MTPRIVAAIVRKDVKAFLRDRFFLYMTVAGLVIYIAVFWLLPSTVDETVSLGVSEPAGSTAVALLEETPGLDVVRYPSLTELSAAVEDGQVIAGLSFPAGFVADVTAGDPVTVDVVVPADIPGEFRYLAEGIVDRLAIQVAGDQAGVDPITRITVLGVDRIGNQVSLQEQMRPLLAFLVLMVETLALASLVASEVQAKTVVAVLATPATVADFLAAKGLLGTGLAFTEAALLMAAVGGIRSDPVLILLALALGAVLVTGLGMIAGSFGKDFMGVLFISMGLMLPLVVPAFGVLFPGSPAPWVKALPSFGLIDAIVGVTVDGEGWAESAPALGLLAGWCAVSFGFGSQLLRRRVATL